MDKPRSFEKKYKLKRLLEREQVFTPCIWDNFSARAVELCGFRSALISSAAVAYSSTGLPDVGLITADEMIQVTERIALASPLALIIDCEGGYGDTPLHAYRTVRRLALAGASAVMMADQMGYGGVERALYREKYLPDHGNLLSRAEWLAKIQASLQAVEGTDCMVIARSGAWYSQGLDEAITRCRMAMELGAHMSLICGITTPKECEKVSQMVPGLKMYPDIISQKGVMDMELPALDVLGFRLVSVHYLEKGAFDGMLRYASRVKKDRNTVWVDEHDMGGRGVRDWMEQMPLYVDYHDWMDFEAGCFASADRVLTAGKEAGQ